MKMWKCIYLIQDHLISLWYVFYLWYEKVIIEKWIEGNESTLILIYSGSKHRNFKRDVTWLYIFSLL